MEGDGGVQRGSDVIQALCWGAQVALVGRPFIWGLTAAGAASLKRLSRDMLGLAGRK